MKKIISLLFVFFTSVLAMQNNPMTTTARFLDEVVMKTPDERKAGLCEILATKLLTLDGQRSEFNEADQLGLCDLCSRAAQMANDKKNFISDGTFNIFQFVGHKSRVEKKLLQLQSASDDELKNSVKEEVALLESRLSDLDERIQVRIKDLIKRARRKVGQICLLSGKLEEVTEMIEPFVEEVLHKSPAEAVPGDLSLIAMSLPCMHHDLNETKRRYRFLFEQKFDPLLKIKGIAGLEHIARCSNNLEEAEGWHEKLQAATTEFLLARLAESKKVFDLTVSLKNHAEGNNTTITSDDLVVVRGLFSDAAQALNHLIESQFLSDTSILPVERIQKLVNSTIGKEILEDSGTQYWLEYLAQKKEFDEERMLQFLISSFLRNVYFINHPLQKKIAVLDFVGYLFKRLEGIKNLAEPAVIMKIKGDYFQRRALFEEDRVKKVALLKAAKKMYLDALPKSRAGIKTRLGRCNLQACYDRLGNICGELGHITEADQYFQSALRLDVAPDMTREIIRRYAKLLVDLGRHDDAIIYCKKGLDLCKKDEINNGSRLYAQCSALAGFSFTAQGDFDNALIHLHNAEAEQNYQYLLADELSNIWTLLAKIYRRQGDVEKTMAYNAKIIDLDCHPELGGQARLSSAIHFFITNLFDMALSKLDQIEEDSDAYPTAIVIRALMHMNKGETAKAEKLFNKALLRIKEVDRFWRPAVWKHKGELLLSKGKYEAGMGFLRKAIDQNDNSLDRDGAIVSFTMNMFFNNFDSKEVANIEKLLKPLLENKPGDDSIYADAHALSAVLNLRAGDSGAACECFDFNSLEEYENNVHPALKPILHLCYALVQDDIEKRMVYLEKTRKSESLNCFTRHHVDFEIARLLMAENRQAGLEHMKEVAICRDNRFIQLSAVLEVASQVNAKEAIDLLEGVVENIKILSKSKQQEMVCLLANAYYKSRRYKDADLWYAKLSFQDLSELDCELVRIRRAVILYQAGKTSDAYTMMNGLSRKQEPSEVVYCARALSTLRDLHANSGFKLHEIPKNYFGDVVELPLSLQPIAYLVTGYHEADEEKQLILYDHAIAQEDNLEKDMLVLRRAQFEKGQSFINLGRNTEAFQCLKEISDSTESIVSAFQALALMAKLMWNNLQAPEQFPINFDTIGIAKEEVREVMHEYVKRIMNQKESEWVRYDIMPLYIEDMVSVWHKLPALERLAEQDVHLWSKYWAVLELAYYHSAEHRQDSEKAIQYFEKAANQNADYDIKYKAASSLISIYEQLGWLGLIEPYLDIVAINSKDKGERIGSLWKLGALNYQKDPEKAKRCYELLIDLCEDLSAKDYARKMFNSLAGV